MKAVIMAGGKGSRISKIASDIPKPMISIGNIPVLEREINNLKQQGIRDIIITVSHLGNVITDYFGNGSGISPATGQPFGVNIEYYFEKEPLGNAGALYEIKDKLDEDFLLLNADSLFNISFRRFIDFHRQKGGLASILTHPNAHPYDSALIETDAGCCVTNWLTKEEPRPKFYKNRVNAGIHILSPSLLSQRPPTPKVDLDRQILKPLAGNGKLFAYDSPEYIKDMGTPERYAAVSKDLEEGIITAKNMDNPQKAIFLDRDGTINKYVGFLTNIDDLELIDDAAKAIKLINDSGYLAVVVTNQPVIARGEVTFDELDAIHNKLETLLGFEGAYLDRIYFCPHHPHKGYEGERPEYKIECECRKPKAGMLLKAAEELNISLENSVMAGDGENDIKAGKAAGCRTALIGSNENLGQDFSAATLYDFISDFLSKKGEK